MSINNLFEQKITIINAGSRSFVNDYERQNISFTHLEWQPPAGGDRFLIDALKVLERNSSKIEEANQRAIERIKASEASLVGLKPAREVIKTLGEYMILHAGPPIKWTEMAGPMQGAIIGAVLFEAWAENETDAIKLIESGKIVFEPCHQHGAVGPMAGIISPTMPVHVIYDEVHQNTAYCSVNEGLGKVLRFGAYDEEVINRLKWIRSVFAPVLDEALHIQGGIDVKNIVMQALQMGDECHNRNKASTSIFLNQITVSILKTKASDGNKEDVIKFIEKNEHYFLNLSMPFCKVTLDSAQNIPYSTLCTVMARNGVEFGVQISGLGSTWYTAPANYVKGLYFAGFDESVATPDLGDSAITETRGIGGFAMGCSPAIVQFVGGNVGDAMNYSKQMHQICDDQNETFTIPALDFYPTALGINVMKVVETGILPIINTGIAHRKAGIGQVGAGLVNPPIECFNQAVLDLAAQIEELS